MPCTSERARRIASLQSFLTTLLNARMVQQAIAHTRAGRFPSNCSTSSSSMSVSTSSSLAFQPNHGIQLINHVYQQLMDIVNHQFLNRFIGPFNTSKNRMIHIEDKLFQSLVSFTATSLNPQVYDTQQCIFSQFRMCKPLFWRLLRLLESNLVFANNSPNGEQQILPHHQIAVALWRLGQYGNGPSLLEAHDQFKIAGEHGRDRQQASS